MKFKDLLLLVGILVIAFVAYIGVYVVSVKEPAKVVVSADGEIFGVYSLSEEKEIEINDTNKLIIKEGHADMIDATCPDHICVDQKEISKTGETIVCLPNKVIVEIRGTDGAELDAVTN